MSQGFFGFMLPEVSWRPPDVSRLPSWRDARVVSIDIETRDEDLQTLGPGVRRDHATNYVCGVSFAIEDGESHYLPVAHAGGDNLDADHVWQYLRDQMRDFSGVITGTALEYDLDWLWNRYGCWTPSVSSIQDVQVRDVLIDELQDRYSLNPICSRWGLPPKDEQKLLQAASAYRVHPKRELWKLPARYVADYAISDAQRPLQIRRRQQVEIDRQGLQQIADLEHAVTPICVKMRHRGVRVDMDKISRIEAQSAGVETDELRKVAVATGVRLSSDDLWSAEALARALRQIGYAGKSVNKAVLDECGEVGAWIKRAREWNKLRTTFCAQMRRYAVHHGNGEYRVHPTTNQLKATEDELGTTSGKSRGRGVRYGRTSCTDPSVQQQPVRHDEFGQLWRSVFVADIGARWGCSDWSQQEPRICVSNAEKLGLPGAREFADEYRRNPRMDIHQKLTDISGKYPRKIVKNYVNGRLYGMGDPKLCGHLDLPVEQRMVRGELRWVAGPEGQKLIDEFRKFAPWIDGLVRHAARVAAQRGYVWTVLRRKCRFPKKPDGSFDWTHKANNRVGQGSAADQMKATLVEADKAGIPVQMVIHDEFDFSFTDIRQARHLKELQENTVKFSVPMLVDLEIGDNWGDLKKDAA